MHHSKQSPSKFGPTKARKAQPTAIKTVRYHPCSVRCSHRPADTLHRAYLIRILLRGLIQKRPCLLHHASFLPVERQGPVAFRSAREKCLVSAVFEPKLRLVTL